MPHAFRVGQLVALAQTSRDPETYEVVQLMPESPVQGGAKSGHGSGGNLGHGGGRWLSHWRTENPAKTKPCGPSE
jgi:hypothetical protein